jgi:hypothetical protein
MTPTPRTSWCATCRRTYETEQDAAACECLAPFPARRGEYPLTVFQYEQGRVTPCGRCSAPMLFTAGVKGAVPLSKATGRRVPCPLCSSSSITCRACAGRRELFLVLSHFLDCPEAERFRRPRRATPSEPDR